jgi:hypothetical protein
VRPQPASRHEPRVTQLGQQLVQLAGLSIIHGAQKRRASNQVQVPEVYRFVEKITIDDSMA